MCGLSASGKSTIAKELSKTYNAIIVSSDEIRKEICGTVENQSKNEEVFKNFHKRIRSYLSEGNNVIADATNITIKSRRVIFENVNKLDVEKICYIVAKNFGDCVACDNNREHSVSEKVLRKQLHKFQIPFKEEGFDKIIIHKTSVPMYTQTDFMRYMKKFNQRNPYHNMCLGEHCNYTYNLFSNSVCLIESYREPFLLGSRLHDVGKLFTQTIDKENIAHYYGHDSVGAYMVLTLLNNPHPEWTSEKLLDCCFLINYHMRPFSWRTEKTHKKWKRIFGEYKYEILLKFHECDKERN